MFTISTGVDPLGDHIRHLLNGPILFYAIRIPLFLQHICLNQQIYVAMLTVIIY